LDIKTKVGVLVYPSFPKPSIGELIKSVGIVHLCYKLSILNGIKLEIEKEAIEQKHIDIIIHHLYVYQYHLDIIIHHLYLYRYSNSVAFENNITFRYK